MWHCARQLWSKALPRSFSELAALGGFRVQSCCFFSWYLGCGSKMTDIFGAGRNRNHQAVKWFWALMHNISRFVPGGIASCSVGARLHLTLPSGLERSCSDQKAPATQAPVDHMKTLVVEPYKPRGETGCCLQDSLREIVRAQRRLCPRKWCKWCNIYWRAERRVRGELHFLALSQVSSFCLPQNLWLQANMATPAMNVNIANQETLGIILSAPKEVMDI